MCRAGVEQMFPLLPLLQPELLAVSYSQGRRGTGEGQSVEHWQRVPGLGQAGHCTPTAYCTLEGVLLDFSALALPGALQELCPGLSQDGSSPAAQAQHPMAPSAVPSRFSAAIPSRKISWALIKGRVPWEMVPLP